MTAADELKKQIFVRITYYDATKIKTSDDDEDDLFKLARYLNDTVSSSRLLF